MTRDSLFTPWGARLRRQNHTDFCRILHHAHILEIKEDSYRQSSNAAPASFGSIATALDQRLQKFISLEPYDWEQKIGSGAPG